MPKILHNPYKLAAPRPASGEAQQGSSSGSQMPRGEGIGSDVLLGPNGELKIHHNGETYSLRKTRFNKLILTK